MRQVSELGGQVRGEPATKSIVWPAVLCVIGLDYFSTLAYQPSIAFETAGIAAPFATVVVVLATLLGALPVYAYLAGRSPDGHGAVGLLERLIHGWRGKTVVIVVLGFVATDFVVTRTISAADAAEHLLASPASKRLLEGLDGARDLLRPLSPHPIWQGALDRLNGQVAVTILLLVLTSAFWLFFRNGFTRRVVQIAVGVVGLYLCLTGVLILGALAHLGARPEILRSWLDSVVRGDWQAPVGPAGPLTFWSIAGLSILVFPQMALGLSGFELSMVVMPLVKGDPRDGDGPPRARIKGTRKLLAVAAVTMSLYLLGSVLVSCVLIPPAAFGPGGGARHRALAYLAHGGALASGGTAGDILPILGPAFGTLYDASTVLILCLAGASVALGLRNLVPPYLSRFGMELPWAHNIGAILHLFNAVNLAVVVIFRASVEAQRGAYVTSVMVLMSAAAVATTIDAAWSKRALLLRALLAAFFGAWSLFFLSTTWAAVWQSPGGILIALCFVAAIVTTSLISRGLRSTELRFEGFEFRDAASEAIWEKLRSTDFPVLVPHRPGRRSLLDKEADIRRVHRLGPEVPVVLVEAELGDTSDFYQKPLIEAREEEGRVILHVTRCVSISHVIAAVGLELSRSNRPPEIHFGWSDESPIAANLNFLIFGEGNVPWLVRELIRRAERDPERRPRVFIG